MTGATVLVVLLLAMIASSLASTHANMRCEHFATCEECANAPLPCDWCVFFSDLGGGDRFRDQFWKQQDKRTLCWCGK
jgi:hypothetical protein